MVNPTRSKTKETLLILGTRGWILLGDAGRLKSQGTHQTVPDRLGGRFVYDSFQTGEDFRHVLDVGSRVPKDFLRDVGPAFDQSDRGIDGAVHAHAAPSNSGGETRSEE